VAKESIVKTSNMCISTKDSSSNSGNQKAIVGSNEET